MLTAITNKLRQYFPTKATKLQEAKGMLSGVTKQKQICLANMSYVASKNLTNENPLSSRKNQYEEFVRLLKEEKKLISFIKRLS